MHVGHFPASAANSLIEGYCDDFVSLAAVLAQTLEQISMRGIDFRASKHRLEQIESGMRNLAEAIHELVAKGQASQPLTTRAQPKSPVANSSQPVVSAPPALRPTGPSNDRRNDRDEAPPRRKPAPPSQKPAPASSPHEAYNPIPHTRTSHPFGGDSQSIGKAPSAQPVTPFGDAPAKTTGKGARGTEAIESLEAIVPKPFKKVDTLSTRPAPARPNSNRAGAGAPTLPRDAKPAAQATEREVPADAIDEGLKGTNASMPILTVFQFLGRMRKSGAMTVTLPEETMTFEFVYGCVQACATTKRPDGDRLGDLIVEAGLCSKSALENLLAKNRSATHDNLGELVLRENLLTNGQLLEALELQVRRRFQRACQAREASYEFHDGFPNRTDGRIRIAPIELSFKASWAQPPNR